MQVYWDMLFGGNYEDVKYENFDGCLDYWCASRYIGFGEDYVYYCIGRVRKWWNKKWGIPVADVYAARIFLSAVL